MLINTRRNSFVQTPQATLNTKLAKQSKELKDETTALEKKLHYLETTAKNSRAHIERLLKGGVGG